MLKEYLFLFCAQRVSVSGVLDHGSDGSMDRCSLRFYICLHVFSGTFGGSFCSANVVLPNIFQATTILDFVYYVVERKPYVYDQASHLCHK